LNLKSPARDHNSGKVKVLLVDDSALVLTILKRMLSTTPDIEVVGTARHGQEALELIPRLQPGVILTDLHMPVMDGLQFTREVMARYPRPILVVSVSVGEDSPNAFNLLEAGAVDVFPKPRDGLDNRTPGFALELVQKIKILAGVRVFRKSPLSTPAPAAAPPPKMAIAVEIKEPLRLVVIGASTGGPQVLLAILAKLPADFLVPVVCVQHISEGFLKGLVEWLASACRMKVRIAQTGEMPAPGVIYFPQERTHLKLDPQGRFVISLEPPVDGHRPSITATMRSVAARYGSGVMGVLLTGMGKDGAEGMLNIARAGGITIAQDEASCVVFGMPKQAIELGAARYVMSPKEMADTLRNGLSANMVKRDYSNQKPGNP
jgi:two-component system chemotaxis response regulator CheB